MTRDEIMNDPRHLLAWRIQSVMANFIPDEYEESWPNKASFAIADAILSGSLGEFRDPNNTIGLNLEGIEESAMHMDQHFEPPQPFIADGKRVVKL